MKTKQISYAYPSSPDAQQFGFTKTGCYTVGIQKDSEPATTTKAFQTYAEASAYADTLPGAFNRWSMPEPLRSCAESGRAGGAARAARLTAERRTEIARKGGIARGKQKQKNTKKLL